jgi:hypothetical protein
MPGQNYVLQERSDERVPEEGVTHTSDPGARLWPVEVHFSTGLRPSRETVRAVSAEQALEFVAARYRFADMARTRVLEEERVTVKAADLAPVRPAAPIVPAPSSHRSIPRVTRGETDALGRTTLSDENIRAAAILHATGRATWDELADTIGCNRDHLRRKAGRMKPSIPAVDLQLPAPVDAAAGPLIALHPAVGWVVAMDSTAEAMTAAGFTAITTLQQLADRR